MRKSKITIIWYTIILIACSAKDTAFTAAFNSAMSAKHGDDRVNALIGLDQQYPDRLAVKVNLGAAMLERGELEKARVYLDRGEELAGRGGDKGLKALLYENLAQVSLLERDFDKAIGYADKALSEGAGGGLLMLKGKALYLLRKKDEAFVALEAGWPKRGDNVARDEIELYLDLLIERGKNEEALGVLEEYLKKYEYRQGISHTASMTAEKAGRKADAILYAYLDLEYQRQYGILSGKEIEKKLLDLNVPEEKALIDGLLAYTRREWTQAHENLAKREAQNVVYRYVKTAAGIESGLISKEEGEAFLKLEGYFKSFPGYYHYAWKGLKAMGVNYTIAEVREILEKCVTLGRGTEYEKPARRELGRLLGLAEVDGENLLIGPELDAIYGYVLQTGKVSELDKVMPMLSLPENVYTLAAVLGLKDLVSRSEAARGYVILMEKKAGGVLKERLGRALAR